MRSKIPELQRMKTVGASQTCNAHLEPEEVSKTIQFLYRHTVLYIRFFDLLHPLNGTHCFSNTREAIL